MLPNKIETTTLASHSDRLQDEIQTNHSYPPVTLGYPWDLVRYFYKDLFYFPLEIENGSTPLTVSDRTKVTNVLHSSKFTGVFIGQTSPAAPRSQGGREHHAGNLRWYRRQQPSRAIAGLLTSTSD
jgi:hypothetical protein